MTVKTRSIRPSTQSNINVRIKPVFADQLAGGYINENYPTSLELTARVDVSQANGCAFSLQRTLDNTNTDNNDNCNDENYGSKK